MINTNNAEFQIKAGGAAASPAAGASAAATPQKSPEELAKLRQAAEAFEAIFLRQMISTMRAATPGDSLFDNQGSEQFRELTDARLADNMANAKGFGIAEMLLKQFGVDDARPQFPLPGNEAASADSAAATDKGASS